MTDQLERILFPLEVDDEGWPPYGAETMWAKQTPEGYYQIDNSPWFAEKVALGDIVSVVWPQEGNIAQYERTISHSGNVSLSVIILDESIEEALFCPGVTPPASPWLLPSSFAA